MANYGMVYDPYTNYPASPTNVMEHLQYLRWYSERKLAWSRLCLIALHIDDPQWIKDKEEEWLNERKYWNGHYGYQSEEWE